MAGPKTNPGATSKKKPTLTEQNADLKAKIESLESAVPTDEKVLKERIAELEAQVAEKSTEIADLIENSGDKIRVKGLCNHKSVKIVGTGKEIEVLDKNKKKIMVPERKTLRTEIKKDQVTTVTREEYDLLTNKRLPQPIVEFFGG